MDPLRFRRDLAGLLVVFGILYLGFSWARPLSNPDEGRYLEIAREMVVTGDWVTPRLNGVLYFYKPPLFYWLQATAIELGGDNRWMLRFWPAALALLGIGLTYWSGHRLFNRATGLGSAVVLGSSLLYYAIGQTILLDMAVSVFIAGALFFFITAVRLPPGPSRARLFCAFYAFIGLSVLSKGLMGILLPGGILFFWFLCFSQWKELRHIYLIRGTLIAGIIALPWHVAVAWQNPEWFSFYIVQEHFQRYLSDISARSQPFWFFLVILPAGLFPWSGFLPQTLKAHFQGGLAGWRSRPVEGFFFITVIFTLLFFSASKSKLIPYILPAYPAAAVLLGNWLAGVWREGREKALLPGLWLVALVSLGIAVAIPWVALAEARKISPDALPWLWTALLLFAACGAKACLFLRRRQVRPAALALAVLALGFLMLFNPLSGPLQRPDTEQVSRWLNTHLEEEDRLAVLWDYYQDLPFHTGHLVTLVDSRPHEQSFGFEWEDHSDRLLRGPELVDRWGLEPFFVVGRHEDLRFFNQHAFPSPWYIVYSDRHFLVVSNRRLGQEVGD